MVALHHPLPTSVQEGGSSLVGVLSSHANVKLVLSGHFHKVREAAGPGVLVPQVLGGSPPTAGIVPGMPGSPAQW